MELSVLLGRECLTASGSIRSGFREGTKGGAMAVAEKQKAVRGGSVTVKARRAELWLSLGSILLALLGGEFAARKFLPPPQRIIRGAPPSPTTATGGIQRADPLLGWALKSGPLEFRHTLSDENGKVQFDVIYSVVNGQRRTSLSTDAKRTEGPVLIAAGCSFTFGHGLNDQDSWPWQLQERLPRYRVMNTADLGYGTDQALMAAERQVKLSPGRTAAVILGFGDFQIERNRASQAWLFVFQPFAKPLFAIGPDGRAVYKRQVRFWSPPVLSESDLFAHAMNIAANRGYGIVSHQGARRLTAALIRTFAERFQAAGIRLAVVMLPWAADQGREPRADRAFIIESLRAAHIPTLTPDFPRLPNGRLDVQRFMVSQIDKHPNREYDQILVSQLEPFLRSTGIVSE
jgi:hypothetical protein